MKCIFAFLIMSFLFVGCRKENAREHVVCINGGDAENNISRLSDVFRDSKIIRLETSEESLIGRSVNKIKKSHGKYYISFNHETLMVFDGQGNFAGRIAGKGGGPGEYSSLVDYDILADGTVVIADLKAILVYAADGTFTRKIPLDIMCFNLMAIDGNRFLIGASGEEYSIYLVDGNGQILSRQLKTDHTPVLGRDVTFIRWGSEKILYQNGFSNDLLCFDRQTGLFSRMDLLCSDAGILSMADESAYRKSDGYNYLDKHANIRIIGGMSSFRDGLFFSMGSRSRGFNCYLVNVRLNTVDCLVTDKVVDDIGFTDAPTLLTHLEKSDSEDCLVTYLYADRIAEGLKEHAGSSDHANYRRLALLLNDMDAMEDENPVLIELK
jgi:hypothetical protein